MATQPTQNPTVTSYPEAPNSATDSQAQFDAKANTFVADQVSKVPQLNTLSDWMNDTAALTYSNAVEAADDAADASSSAQTAIATSNFKGLWSDLSGPLPLPAAVSHSGYTWRLLSNLANVESEEPSFSSSFWEPLRFVNYDEVRLDKLNRPLFSISPFRDEFTGDGVATFTNASANRSYYDRYNQLSTSGVNTRRFARKGELITTSYTNELLYSNDFTNAAWGKLAATVTANSGFDAVGVQRLTKLQDNDALSTGSISQVVNSSITDDSNMKIASIELATDASGSPLCSVRFQLIGGSTSVISTVFVDMSSGIPVIDDTKGGYDFADLEYLGNGNAVLRIGCQNNGTGNVNSQLIIYPTGNSIDPSLTGYVYAGDTIISDQSQIMPFFTTTSSPLTSQADNLTYQISGNMPRIYSEWSIAGSVELSKSLSTQSESIFSVETETGLLTDFLISRDANNTLAFRFNTSGVQTFLSSALSSNKISFCVTHKYGEVQMYINGELVSESLVGEYIDLDITGNIGVLSRFNAGTTFAGYHQGFSIYDFHLNPEEAKVLAGVK